MNTLHAGCNTLLRVSVSEQLEHSRISFGKLRDTKRTRGQSIRFYGMRESSGYQRADALNQGPTLVGAVKAQQRSGLMSLRKN